MQRLHAAHHREIRHQRVVGVHEQLRPRPLDRHRLDGAAVARQPSLLDDAARLEELHRATVRHPVERHRQRRAPSASTPRSAHVIATRSESPASWNSGAVGLSEEKSMSRSLRMNTRPPATRPCTRPAICRISFAPRCSLVSTFLPRSTIDVKRDVVDHDGVESVHVERALSRRRHREEVRLLLSALEERPQLTRIGSPPW